MSGANNRTLTAAQTKEEELDILSKIKICPANNSVSLEDLNSIVLKSKLENDFYSASLMQALSCYFDVTLKGHITDKLPSASPELIRELTHPHRIGAESVEGVALLTGIGDTKDLVVIKAPKDPKNDGLLHEYFVGMTALNKLRQYNPSFMYTFTGFTCSAPVIKGKEVVEWCEPQGPQVNYVVFEKIIGKGFEDILSNTNITLKQYLSYLLQGIYAHKRAVADYGFTHYDEHTGNWLIGEVPGVKREGITENGPFYVPFIQNGNGVTKFVKSDGRTVIIDFGRVHILYNGKHFGFHDKKLQEEDGLYSNKVRPLYDMFKIIGFSLDDLLNAKSKSDAAMKLFRELMPLYQFFRPVRDYPSYVASVKNERKSYFVMSVEISQKEKESSLDDLLKWIEEKYPDEFADLVFDDVEDDALILTCGGLMTEKEEEEGSCPTTAEAINSLMKMNLVPKSRTMTRKKSARSLLREKSQAERRLIDLNSRGKTINTNSNEYLETQENRTRSLKALREDNEDLREELDINLVDLKKKIKEEYDSYNGVEYTDDVYATAKDNGRQLGDTIDAITSSGLLVLVQDLKQYLADLYTLMRLEEISGGNTVVPRKYKLSAELLRVIRSDTAEMTDYLNNISPLNNRDAAIRDTFVRGLDVDIVDYDTEQQI